MTPNLGTWETINADVTDRGRRGQIKLVWERHGEINYRQAIFCCSDFQASAVLQTICLLYTSDAADDWLVV